MSDRLREAAQAVIDSSDDDDATEGRIVGYGPLDALRAALREGWYEKGVRLSNEAEAARHATPPAPTEDERMKSLEANVRDHEQAIGQLQREAAARFAERNATTDAPTEDDIAAIRERVMPAHLRPVRPRLLPHHGVGAGRGADNGIEAAGVGYRECRVRCATHPRRAPVPAMISLLPWPLAIATGFAGYLLGTSLGFAFMRRLGWLR